jgi:conjugative relaxase-like TrwC/TraI family protein
MTVHVLHAGDGYTYLTRQVAVEDTDRGRGQGLADYYTLQGSPPGRWAGAGLDGLGVTGTVSEAQMKALFGEGLHPDADRIVAAQIKAGNPPDAALRAAKLGRAFPRFHDTEGTGWRDALMAGNAHRAAQLGVRVGELSAEDRAAVRQQVGRERFRGEHGRDPVDVAELRQFISAQARPARQPVAGYDLVFTPAKSVSVLWALGAQATRVAVEQAHAAAVARAMAYLERNAAFTRQGAGGVAQIDTRGLVAACFDHRDSRNGDPNLHTHMAVANKVQGPDGRWRSIDGRVLHAAGVSASETYTTAIEDELTARLGVLFTQRATGDGRRPVREIQGIPVELIARFSSRRTGIEDRYRAKLADYRDTYGHEAPRHVQHELAQEATLETRDGKDAPRSLAEQRAQWRGEAIAVVGEDLVDQLTARCTRKHRDRGVTVGEVDVDQVAARVVERVETDRSRWKIWHLRAEAERQLRGVDTTGPEEREHLVEQVTSRAVAAQCLRLEVPDEAPTPGVLRRRDGESVFRVHGEEWYTSTTVFDAEDRLSAAAQTPAKAPVDPEIFAAQLAAREHAGERPLDAGQLALAHAFATTERLVCVGVGPAGAGKTTTMRVFADTVHAAGGRVVCLAPSAAAAKTLGEELGVHADTVAKILHTARTQSEEETGVEAGDVLLVDEAGMAATRDLDDLVQLASRRGAVVRLLGDPQQLSAVEAGGALRMLARETGAVELYELHRFHSPEEAAASLQLRDGDPAGLDFYDQADRIRGGTGEAVTDDVYTGWRHDQEQGREAIMVAARNETVLDLNQRARLDRVAGGAVELEGVELQDGTTAGVGDIVVTRRNDRTLAAGRRGDWVKNGDLWDVVRRHADGSLRLRHHRHHGHVRVPADYVRRDVELGYASTIHRAQGITVDTAHVIVDPTMGREALYVAATRGRSGNRLYVVNDATLDPDLDQAPDAPGTALEVLAGVLGRETGDRSARDTVEEEFAAADSLARLVPEYEHARGLLAAQRGEVDAVLRQALPARLVADVRAEQAWPALAARIVHLVDTIPDPAAALQAAVQAGSLDDAHSVAKVLTHRLDLAHGAPPALEPAAAAAAAPGAARDDRGVEGWLVARRHRIQGRIDTLTDDAVTTQPRWLVDHIGPRPVTAAADDTYLAAVRAVAAYRDRYTITSTRTALGPEPGTEGPQLRAWRAATDRVEDYRARATSAGPGPGEAGPSLREQVAARAEQARQDTAQRRSRAEQHLAAQRAEQRWAQEQRDQGRRGPRW